MTEEQEFLDKEIQVCNDEMDKAIKTSSAAQDVLKFYARRKEFLTKILNLIGE